MTLKKSFTILGALGLVFLLGVLPMFPLNTGFAGSSVIPSSSAASCPSSDIMHAAFYGGAISTFNDLTLAGPQHEAPNFVQTEGIYPLAAPDGQLSWATSLVQNVTSNANYTVWTFNLKPGLKWSDGNPITAQDIVNNYSPKYAFDPSNDFVFAHNETISVVAKNTTAAVFTLNKPDAHYPEKIGPSFFTSLYESSSLTSPSFTGFDQNFPSSGPFFVGNYSQSSTQVTYYRNPYYQPQPKICEVQVNLVESSGDVAPLLVAGTADYGAVDATSVPNLLATGHIKVISEGPGLAADYFTYNPQEYPFNMTQFREALVYAINESAIVQQAYDGYAVAAYNSQGGVPTTTQPWYNANQATYSFDQNKSIQLLNSLGFKLIQTGNARHPAATLEYPNGTAVSYSMWVDNAYSSNVVAAGLVQSDLRNIGIQINIQTAALGTIIGYSFHNNFGINNGLIMGESGGMVGGLPLADALPVSQVYYSWAQPAPTWEWPQSANNQYESNLSAFMATANPTQMKTYLDNIQSINAQYLPMIHLAWPGYLFAFNTQKWTNIPAAPTIEGSLINGTAWTQIAPVASVSTSASNSGTTSSNSATSSSSSSSSSSVSLPLSYLAVVVIVILVGASLAALGVRTKGRMSTLPRR